jgi:WD40 repeat protein
VRSLATADGGHLVAAVDGWYGKVPANQPSTEEGELAIWRDGKLVGKPLRLGAWGYAVAFSPDGSTVAAGVDPAGPSSGARVLVVDARTGKLERTILPANTAGNVTAVAFSRDGVLADGAWSGIVDLWNPKTGRHIGHSTLVAPFPVASIAFAPDGKTFATAPGSSGGTRIWVTATQQQLGSDLPGAEGAWGAEAYTPNGRYLLSVFGALGRAGRSYRWPASLAAWEQRACSVAGRNFTSEEWQRFVGGGSVPTVCATR